VFFPTHMSCYCCSCCGDDHMNRAVMERQGISQDASQGALSQLWLAQSAGLDRAASQLSNPAAVQLQLSAVSSGHGRNRCGTQQLYKQASSGDHVATG
jgi:hypothetical protein